jgi:hypothetical protein
MIYASFQILRSGSIDGELRFFPSAVGQWRLRHYDANAIRRRLRKMFHCRLSPLVQLVHQFDRDDCNASEPYLTESHGPGMPHEEFMRAKKKQAF